MNSTRYRVALTNLDFYARNIPCQQACPVHTDARAYVTAIAEGDYERTRGDGETSNQYSDETLSALAAEFATMAAKVKQREEELKQQIVELKIAIDQSQREEEVKRVTASRNFEDLRAKAKAMREAAQKFDEG